MTTILTVFLLLALSPKWMVSWVGAAISSSWAAEVVRRIGEWWKSSSSSKKEKETK